ncbi:glycine-rich domain-containing protein [Paraburkholderia domus]|uniref:glycine-rich domain-containing protein n=1 Tax=Paraburkholderia domus TaxID=2793075 RepID=UPI0019148D2C|nr:glycine-rich domain-containing protein-like [Paraburkholderia domus]MBK5063444.1 glycine-rich domain-containing protein-like [Burkholderia sp. R-70199]CAE6916897.1 hypothetical protein R70199_04654 [Paraburkholderia domus]
MARLKIDTSDVVPERAACCDQDEKPEIYIASLPGRIEDDKAAFLYATEMDFVLLSEKIVDERSLTLDQVEDAGLRYKKWLFLRRKFPGELMPPPEDIDLIWHYHILDTHAYFRDTAAILGYYLHHYPYFGNRGPADRQKLDSAFENTKKRWSEIYTDPLTGQLPKWI